MFARHGVPSEVVSDNGPQFACANFKDFSHEWDFIHTTSSPRYAQSNGEAERYVQTIKDMFKKAEEGQSDIYISLMEYRASPIEGVGLSPAQLLFNRQLKTKLPMSTELLEPKAFGSKQKELMERQKRQKHYYDKTSKPLPSIAPGEIVRFKKEDKSTWEPAIVDTEHSERSYVLRAENDKLYRRNRKHILKTNEKVFNKDNSQNDLEFPMVDNSIDREPPTVVNHDQQETLNQASAPTEPTTVTRSGRISRKPAYLTEHFV
ncbi:unnamed protein product [Mytilus edulis]|uniref:Integrase catalytic domain-containing protein n=1 Tax=Mytilus edulis TaxID=6550 RepID=A0A8S3PSY9_MYTED|nr:unnamed protein product [Mytilus edulis]